MYNPRYVLVRKISGSPVTRCMCSLNWTFHVLLIQAKGRDTFFFSSNISNVAAKSVMRKKMVETVTQGYNRACNKYPNMALPQRSRSFRTPPDVRWRKVSPAIHFYLITHWRHSRTSKTNLYCVLSFSRNYLQALKNTLGMDLHKTCFSHRHISLPEYQLPLVYFLHCHSPRYYLHFMFCFCCNSFHCAELGLNVVIMHKSILTNLLPYMF